jgi:hypothetical protein
MSLSPKHFFKFFCISLAWSLTSQVFAIQIISPVLYSRTDEALKLSFLITDLSAAEEQGLKVALAADKVYQSTQITKVGGLDDLQFEVSKQADGNYKVLLTGKQAIPHRHADLIIELEWASGRRYINLGLDFEESAPPTSEANKDKPSVPLVEQPSAEPVTTQAASTEPVIEKTVTLPEAVKQPAAVDKTAPAETAPQTASPPSPEPSNHSLEVKPGDTASKLLLSHPVEGVSLDQLLLAMLHMNPHAFVNDNVNRLAAGALVTLPNADEAGTYDARHAHESIRLQATDFKAYRASLAAKVPDAKKANVSKRESSGNLKADVTATAKTPDDQLSLSKPGDTEADKLSKQLQEEDAAKQVKEVQDNLGQLGQLSQAMSRFKEGLAAKFPMLSATYEQSMVWIKRHVFELIGGFALLVALIVSYSVMRERRREEDPHLSTDDNQNGSANHAYAHEMSLPPELNLNLDLDIAPEPSPTPLPPQAIKADAPPVRQSVIDPGEDPFLMRLELADELWKLGQKQTALALAQEVADQTHGETRDMAQRWLKDRA